MNSVEALTDRPTSNPSEDGIMEASPVHSSSRMTHALSPAFRTSVESLAVNGVETLIDRSEGYTPTPAISHAILKDSCGRTLGTADGILITPSHKPARRRQVLGAPIAECYGIDTQLVNDTVDPRFSFMSLDWDAQGPHGLLVAVRDWHRSAASRTGLTWLLATTATPTATASSRAAAVRRIPTMFARVRCLRRYAPAGIPGLVFLSGGQNDLVATMHLSAINQVGRDRSRGSSLMPRARPAGRNAQGLARTAGVGAARQAFYHRAKSNSAAALGRYTTAMETESVVACIRRAAARR